MVVVGGGMAGFGLCQRLAKLRPAHNLHLTLFGEEPHPAYDRVNLSRLFSTAGTEPLHLATRQWYADQQIELHTGRRILRIDPTSKTIVDDLGNITPYDQLVLATGSSAWVPPIPGAESKGVFVYRTIDDLLAIQNHVSQHDAKVAAVIGGGLLGLEAVKVLLDMGIQSSVIEVAPGLMPRQLDSVAAVVLKQRVETLGVQVLLTTRTERIEQHASGLKIHCVEAPALDVDLLVVAAGIRPRDDLAESANLETGKRGGFAVNDRLQTSNPDIYAIGECASINDYTYGLVAPCYRMADALADQLVGVDTRFTEADESAELKLLGVPVVALGKAIGSSPDGIILTHQDEVGYRKIIVEENRVVGAAGVGDWEDIDTVRIAVGNHGKLGRRRRARFVQSGRLSPAGAALSVQQWPANATVCACHAVTRGVLSSAIAEGFSTTEQLIERTGATTGCGSCHSLVCEMAGSPIAQPPLAGATVVLVTSIVSLILSVLIVLLPPIPMSESVQDSWRNLDFIWRDSFMKQVSGYSLLAISILGMAFSLRKRTKLLKVGSYGFWRAVHTAMGIAILAGVVAHTGMSMGANLNFLLSFTFLSLAAVGSIAGVASGLESRATGNWAMLIRSWRPRLTKLHIWLLWPLPVLIGIHIICVYWY